MQVGALTTWYQIAAGTHFTIATKTDGTLWSWGNGLNGRLGVNSTVTHSSPVQVGALTTWYQIAVGDQFALATKTDGTLWSWGTNAAGQLGLGDAAGTNRSSPVQVGALTTWSKVAAGGYHSVATKTDGTLWIWGRNATGQLGLNDTINTSSPVQVGLLTTWSQVAGSLNFTSAIKTDGTLWAWGLGTSGQLGAGDDISRSSPVQIGSLTTWSKLPKMPRSNSSLAITKG